MRIILARPRGFCAGVNMAIEALESALAAYGTPLYVYHEIVHNKRVVGHFRQKGVVFVDDLGEVPEGAHLLYSAHGVPPSVRQQARGRRLKTIDATCPLVTKVHREAVQFAGQGYTILLIGHAGHDEVVGTMGEVAEAGKGDRSNLCEAPEGPFRQIGPVPFSGPPESIRLIETAGDIDRVEVADPSRVAYLTQTTLSVDDAARIIEHLRRRFPQAVGPQRDDICYATQNRQEAIRMLAPQCDLVLVVGSRNSSNSRRLTELAEAYGVPAHLIDGPADIDLGWFSGEEKVLLTAGASAPESLVEQCVAMLQEHFAASVETRVVREEQVRFALPEM